MVSFWSHDCCFVHSQLAFPPHLSPFLYTSTTFANLSTVVCLCIAILEALHSSLWFYNVYRSCKRIAYKIASSGMGKGFCSSSVWSLNKTNTFTSLVHLLHSHRYLQSVQIMTMEVRYSFCGMCFWNTSYEYGLAF